MLHYFEQLYFHSKSLITLDFQLLQLFAVSLSQLRDSISASNQPRASTVAGNSPDLHLCSQEPTVYTEILQDLQSVVKSVEVDAKFHRTRMNVTENQDNLMYSPSGIR